MGAEVQCKMYLQGYYSLKDLDNNAGKGTWPLHQEQKILRSGQPQYQDMFLTRPDIHRYEEYEKELLRQTILKHETIFRHQLHELHRLYKIQMDLMNHIRSKEPHKHLMLAGTLQSSNVFLSEDDTKRWHIGLTHMSTLSLMDSCYGRPSTLGTIMQSNFGPTQGIVKHKDHKPLVPKSIELQRRFFDLEVPADEFISNDVEPQRVSELSGVHDHPSNRVNGIALDLNEITREEDEITWEEEASALAITGHKTNSKEEMNSSASAYLSLQLLAKEFSQNLRNGGDGAEQFALSNTSSLCGILRPDDFPKPCESSQTPKVHDPATCFPFGRSKIEQHRKRTIFGVENSDINRDSSFVASHALGLQNALVPKFDVANSESFTILPGTKPSGSSRQHLISTEGNLCSNTCPQSNKSSITLMQSSEMIGELLKDNSSRSLPDARAKVSYQNDVCLGSQSESKELKGCHPSVWLGFPNEIHDRHFTFGKFQQHNPQNYLGVSGSITDVSSPKEVDMDAVSLNNPFKVICQQNLISVDWSRNRENSQGACSWLRPMPICNGKYSREREGLSSWQNHCLQVVHRQEMIKDPPQSFVQDSSSATHADDSEHGKIEIGDCSIDQKILGFPITDKPHVLNDLPSHSSPSKPSCLASAIDNGNLVKFGLSMTDLADDPLLPRSGQRDDRPASRYQIDLNICVTEEEVLFTPSSPIATKIDLEVPVVNETEIIITPVEGSPESKSREPFDVLKDESRVLHEGPIMVAADALVSISSSHMHNLPGNAADNLQEHATCHQSEASLTDSLHWLADIISSYKGDNEKETVEVSMGRVEDYCCKPQTLENPKDENTLPRKHRRGQTRRGRQRKDFQRDILPSLTSLSRNEVTEDLQTIEGLIKATGGTWQSRLVHRNSGMSCSGRGRRRSGVSHPSSIETPVCLRSAQQLKCIEVGFEEKSLTGWGKKTRPPPRQRCLINSPLPLK
ncbi:hypothetical protein CIPAW_03G092200 [Carya illinoinensis]|uniref:Uncharacterized protein n=1 Tax=Carya illinoinensis TaxID=32201 RepID=A0A8T1QYQ7_CARIL|nr:hypothetical protein CIPAW_03G092200 [Carya illinoinensis]